MEQIRVEEYDFVRTELPARLGDVQHQLTAAYHSTESESKRRIVSLALKLTIAVVQTGADLLAATNSPTAVALVAWYARNMVELRVWIRYCRYSDECAERFSADALRDFRGIVESLAEMSKVIGQDLPTEQHSYEQLDQIAKEKFGLDGIDTEFERVASAARAVGLSVWYKPTNKYLSKFAHPTAGLVLGLMHQEEHLPAMQFGCFIHGSNAAHFCVLDLEGMAKAMS
jgi:hypothetical protein